MLRTNLQGKSAIVLGGTKGIGRASATRLAENGANVLIVGRDQDAGRDLCRSLGGDGREVAFTTGDLGDAAEVDRLMSDAAGRFGRLDICVSSGAPRQPRPLPIDQIDGDAALALVVSRLQPRLFALLSAGRVMRRQGYGKIVLLTTDAARIPTRSESMVGAAGAAVMFLTRSVAREIAADGVRVNAVSTTITMDTPSYEAFRQAGEGASSEVLHQAFATAEQRAAFGLNSATDVAELVLYLCSPESDQLSGATISINGGVSFPSY
jgi:2-hydroxycyclohexanecarboxyl-CoA dehydrogenase